MIIDFHAHAFPDQIAEKAISTLQSLLKYMGEEIKLQGRKTNE